MNIFFNLAVVENSPDDKPTKQTTTFSTPPRKRRRVLIYTEQQYDLSDDESNSVDPYAGDSDDDLSQTERDDDKDDDEMDEFEHEDEEKDEDEDKDGDEDEENSPAVSANYSNNEDMEVDANNDDMSNDEVVTSNAGAPDNVDTGDNVPTPEKADAATILDNEKIASTKDNQNKSNRAGDEAIGEMLMMIMMEFTMPIPMKNNYG